jgi:hypothetical protein
MNWIEIPLDVSKKLKEKLLKLNSEAELSSFIVLNKLDGI